MKIKSCVVLMLIVSIVLISLAWVFPAIAQPVGKITALSGNVDITSPGAKARAAALNDPVSEGDFIRAKSKSRAEITFTDGNILRLAANSRIRITQYASSQKTPSSLIHLMRGKIFNIIKGVSGDRYEVHTPDAVSGVRGTQFYNYYIDGVSAAVFEQGTGYAYNKKFPDDVRKVSAGQGVYVAGSDRAPMLRNVTEAEMMELRKATEAPASSETSESQESPVSSGDTASGQTLLTLLDQDPVEVPASDPPSPLPPDLTPAPEPAPEPAPVVQTSILDMAISTDTVVFAQKIDSGVIGGSGSPQLDGVAFNIATSGAYTGDPASPAGALAGGTIETGGIVNTGVSGYWMGLPLADGTWRLLASGVYVDSSEQAGFLKGYAVNTLTGGIFSGEGQMQQSLPQAKTTAPPLPLALSPWTDVSLPVFGNVFLETGLFEFDCTGATCLSESRGIEANDLSDGRPLKMGVGAGMSIGGTFNNPGAITSVANERIFGYDSTLKTAYFGKDLAITVDEAQRRVDMNATLMYMNTRYAGHLRFQHLGSYDAMHHYASISVFAAQLEPLAQANELNTMMDVDGLMGTARSVWTQDFVPMTYMGYFFSPRETAGIWESYNYAASNHLTNDGGGAYKGYHLAQRISDAISLDHLGLYVDADGNAGILHGNSSTGPGGYDPHSGFFMAEGASGRTELAAGTGLSAADLVSTGTASETYVMEEELSQPTVGSFERLQISGLPRFFIGRIDLTGDYVGTPDAYVVTGFDLLQGLNTVGSKRFIFTELGRDYTEMEGGSFFGNMTGAMADWQSAFTAVSGGHVKGTYDPALAGTWSATLLASFVETSTFIAMAETESGQAKLAELNIPHARVGTVSLSGSDANSQISINDIGFYAYSTGAKPSLWASSQVTGQYTAPPRHRRHYATDGRRPLCGFCLAKLEWGRPDLGRKPRQRCRRV